MNKKDLLKKVAKLESFNDQILAEINFLDTVMKKLGFKEGLKTLKATAQELLKEQMDE